MMFRRQALSVATLAAATLLLESTLTRLLAVAQYYHFAFLVVSLALLGYGASGTLLTISPGLRKLQLDTVLFWSGIGFCLSVGLAYAVVNFLPFDSYAIAWDRRQIFFFILYYISLTIPFLVSGLAAGSAISASRGKSHLFYAANLFGSGLGVLLAPLALWLAGVPGAVLFSAILGLAAVFPVTSKSASLRKSRRSLPNKKYLLEKQGRLPKSSKELCVSWCLGVFGVGIIGFAVLSTLNLRSGAPLGMTISPYKGLAQVRRFPKAETLFRRWNAISRVDVLENAGMHHLPGLSYQYDGPIPPQLGLAQDADSLQPISLIPPGDFESASSLPEALAFELRPGAETLVIDPGGGLGVLQSLAGGAKEVTAVIDNPLILDAISRTAPEADVYSLAGVRTVLANARVYLRRDQSQYAIIFYPLTDAYRPVTSGAYSLGEEYDLTVEAFGSSISRLAPDGLLVISRWTQTPPSESLRLVGTVLEALESHELGDLAETLILYRGIQTMTVLVKPSGWAADELAQARQFLHDHKFDLVWAPDIREEEVNRYNRLPSPIYYDAVRALLTTADRSDIYTASTFDITPPTDDDPFFFHFFTWQQTPEVLATMGHIWQPFGGSGYLILFALLGLVVVLSFGLILFPLGITRFGPPSRAALGRGRIRWRALAYFSLLGFAFLFIEIPLIQKSILVFGHPTYAFTVVVFAMLLSSSFGSALTRAHKLPQKTLLLTLVVLAFLLVLFFPELVKLVLGWPLVLRVSAVVMAIAPLGTLMGMPFPLGLIALERTNASYTPWVWAVNGCASVIASVLAAILALSYGFSLVLFLGSTMYAAAAALYVFTFDHKP